MPNIKGFTLIEMMIVLSIISVVGGLSLLSLQPMHEAKTIDYFLTQFENDLLLGQQMAISKGEASTVIIDNDNDRYVIRQLSKVKISRGFDSSIHFQSGTLGLTSLVFRPNGHIQRPGTMFIQTRRAKYRVVFLLGKGRFYLEKM